jgi:mannose-1-phosphate guanylyltransferase
MLTKFNNAACSPLPCGIVLAAGDGVRLRPFVRRLRGDALPKQYMNFIGARSMLEHTFCRAEVLIPPDRLFTVVSQDHLKYHEVRKQLSSRPGDTVIVQPENKETLPGLLLPLMHLNKRYPGATVVVFPSDHFIVEEDLFMAHVEEAFRFLESDPSRLVILGVEPNSPDPDLGYILPGKAVKGLVRSDLQEILRFIEKPDRNLAHELIQRGGLWNTMVMIFKAETLLHVVKRITPALYGSFQDIAKAIGTRFATEIVEQVYKRIGPANFSKRLLETLPLQCPSPAVVRPVRYVQWSDWGSETRVVRILREIGHLRELGKIPANAV